MKKVIISLVAMFFIFMSCEKESVTESTVTELTTEAILNDDASIEDALETTDYEVDYFAGSDASMSGVCEEMGIQLKSAELFRWRLRYLAGQAPNVSIDTSENFFPITITLDYGDGTELINGKILSGKIIITVTAPLRVDGSQRTVEFENFYVDSVGVEGSYSNTFTAGLDSTKAIFTYNRRLQLNFYDGTSVIRNENKVREWVTGFNTPFYHGDDEIHITGSAETTSADGVSYTREITEALVKMGACRFIVSGVVEFAIDGEVQMILDYGDGDCDCWATVTKDGEENEIRIGKWHKRIRR